MSANRDRNKHFINDVLDILKAILRKFGIDEKVSEEIATDFLKSLRFAWGGIQLYIPKVEQVNIQERNKKIREEFNGHNHYELCKIHNLSLQQVYHILKGV